MGLYNPAFLREVAARRAAALLPPAEPRRSDADRAKHGRRSRAFESGELRRDGGERIRERDEAEARHRRAEALAVPDALAILAEYEAAVAARKRREADLPDFLLFSERDR